MITKKTSPEKAVKPPVNLFNFYSWVDESIENRLGRQKYLMVGDSNGIRKIDRVVSCKWNG